MNFLTAINNRQPQLWIILCDISSICKKETKFQRICNCNIKNTIITIICKYVRHFYFKNGQITNQWETNVFVLFQPERWGLLRQGSIKWSSTSSLPPSHPSSHSSAAPSGLNRGWMDGGNEGGKWMYVWRSRSIGYYHQHTLSKLYGNYLNHSISWETDGWMEGMERNRERKRRRKEKRKTSVIDEADGEYEPGKTGGKTEQNLLIIILAYTQNK